MTNLMRSDEWGSISARQVGAEDRQQRARDFLFAKHYGPGLHPSGSGQEVHGSSRISTVRGIGSLNKQPVEKFLVTEHGVELRNSFETLDRAFVSINGKIKKTRHAKDIKERILAAVHAEGLDPDSIDANLSLVFESALARYAEDPSMVDKDRFYEAWHAALQTVAAEADIEFSSVIAAAAVISPSLEASANLHFAHDLAVWVKSDVNWTGDDADAIRQALTEGRDGILTPVYFEDHEDVKRGLVKTGDPKPPPEEGSYRWNQGKQIEADLEAIGDGDFSLSDLSSYSAAYALHAHRSRFGGLDIPDDVPEIFRGTKPANGFSVKNYAFYGNAISVLRGEQTASEVLGDIKTRSFHNNILDPLDDLGHGDVTVDFHMIDAAFMARGFIDHTLVSSPAFEGVGVGVRPLVADGVHRIAGTDLNGETLSTGRVQEILWAEWNRGAVEKRLVPDGVPMPEWAINAGPRTVTHFKAMRLTPKGNLVEVFMPLYNVGKVPTGDEKE